MNEQKPTPPAAAPAPAAIVAIGNQGLKLQSIDDLFRFSKAVIASGFAPKGIDKAESVFIAVQMGLEVGLTPMAALRNIAVINGRPAMWGDAVLAICRATGEVESFEEFFESGPDDKPVRLARNPVDYPDHLRAVCRVQRTGQPVHESSFSVSDAKRAKLWGKAGPWTEYPFRMLKARARAFALRDQFGDALSGIHSADEARDEPRRIAGSIIEQAHVPLLFSPEATPEPQESKLDEFRNMVKGAKLDGNYVDQYIELEYGGTMTEAQAADAVARFGELVAYCETQKGEGAPL